MKKKIYILKDQKLGTISNPKVLQIEDTSKDTESNYKIYTALLTQSGVNNSVPLSNPEPTVIGVRYVIQYSGLPSNEDWDFTGIGAPNNSAGTWFVATGTNPVWGGGGAILTYIAGVPVPTVLENTIGNIWFTYAQAGLYVLNSEVEFPANKTVFQNTLISIEDGTYLKMITITPIDSYSFYIGSVNFPDTLANGLLNNTPIEIKVYN